MSARVPAGGGQSPAAQGQGSGSGGGGGRNLFVIILLMRIYQQRHGEFVARCIGFNDTLSSLMYQYYSILCRPSLGWGGENCGFPGVRTM